MISKLTGFSFIVQEVAIEEFNPFITSGSDIRDGAIHVTKRPVIQILNGGYSNGSTS
jgi:hypothetical protein